jgi:2',3'-cyclic-nucleotide 2'-phosphodiesterase (5'-nucleotidase family)
MKPYNKPIQFYHLFLTIFFVASCTGKLYKTSDAGFLIVDDQVIEDERISAFIQPYKAQLEAEMNTIIGETAAAIIKNGNGETPLGNLVADFQKEFAETALGYPIDISIINNGGMRNNLPEGPITLGNIYELSPFDNYLHVLILNGNQVLNLAEFAFERKILGISGMFIEAYEDELVNVKVNGKDIDFEKSYLLAVNDYLASGGDNMEFLVNLPRKEETDFLLREIIIHQIKDITKNSEKIFAQTEGRQKYN